MSISNTLKGVERYRQFHHRGVGAVYAVRLGDTLSSILTDYYRIRRDEPKYVQAEAFALYYNPKISHPDHIVAGSIIRLMPLPEDNVFAFCPAPSELYKPAQVATRHRLEPARSDDSAYLRDRLPINEEERDIFLALARAQEKYSWLEFATGGAASFAHITGPGNAALVQEVGELYQQYKNGQLTKGQYDYQRAKALKTLSKNLMPLQRFLFNGETVNEAVSITRKKALPATSKITASVAKLSDLSTLAKSSGVILTAVSGAIACENIANAEDREEKNEIFVEFVGNTAVSSATGVVLGLIFVSTPLGWLSALTIGVGTVASGWIAGKGLKHLYDSKFNKYDLVEISGVERWCN